LSWQPRRRVRELDGGRAGARLLPQVNQQLEEPVKSRIIVWSLVGIVVIVGVIVIATAPKRKTSGPKITLDTVKSEVADAEAQLDRLAARLDARRKAAPQGAGVRAFDEADRLLAEARDKLGQAKEAVDLKEARQLMVEARETLRKARRAVELATKPKSRPRGIY
jgi:hypothetical protein